MYRQEVFDRSELWFSRSVSQQGSELEEKTIPPSISRKDILPRRLCPRLEGEEKRGGKLKQNKLLLRKHGQLRGLSPERTILKPTNRAGDDVRIRWKGKRPRRISRWKFGGDTWKNLFSIVDGEEESSSRLFDYGVPIRNRHPPREVWLRRSLIAWATVDYSRLALSSCNRLRNFN